MKYLLLIRHAKSDWNDPSIADIDRPLNERGKRDAPEMAKRLKDKDISIDAFISSPAKRARKTAVTFAKEYKQNRKDVYFQEALYGANPEDFYKVIEDVKDKFDSIAIISHNPGLTDFANDLTETHIDNVPTCGVFAVKADCKNWKDFKEAKKEFWFFDSPKEQVKDKN